jgi:hypothetical protein
MMVDKLNVVASAVTCTGPYDGASLEVRSRTSARLHCGVRDAAGVRCVWLVSSKEPYRLPMRPSGGYNMHIAIPPTPPDRIHADTS